MLRLGRSPIQAALAVWFAGSPSRREAGSMAMQV